MATSAKTSRLKTKAAKSDQPKKTSAPKVSRARKSTAATVTTEVTAPAYDVVAERAFARFCARGHEHGHDVEDWLAAEAELRRS